MKKLFFVLLILGNLSVFADSNYKALPEGIAVEVILDSVTLSAGAHDDPNFWIGDKNFEFDLLSSGKVEHYFELPANESKKSIEYKVNKKVILYTKKDLNPIIDRYSYDVYSRYGVGFFKTIKGKVCLRERALINSSYWQQGARAGCLYVIFEVNKMLKANQKTIEVIIKEKMSEGIYSDASSGRITIKSKYTININKI